MPRPDLPAGAPAPTSPLATHPARRAAFGGLLVTAMASGTFLTVALGLLATYLLDEFGITRAQLGVVIAVTAIGGALLSPVAGRVADHAGGKAAFAGLFAISAAGFLLLAAAPGYLLLFPAGVLAAAAQAAANPATNKLIALHLPLGRRGVMTGIKQSGVQFGIFTGGLAVPAGAESLGWRPTVVLVALVPLVALPLALAVVPRDRPAAAARPRRTGGPLPGAIGWLAWYGALRGFASSTTFLVPLFVEEALGRSPVVGGAAAGTIGLVAAFGRIGWARAAEQLGTYVLPLGWIAALSVVAAGTLGAATTLGLGALWVGVVLTGVSASTWNSVGMLAVMDEAGPERAGRASGVVMFGFLAGLGLGPPAFGLAVDVTGSYAPMWSMSAAAAVAATVLTEVWRRRRR